MLADIGIVERSYPGLRDMITLAQVKEGVTPNRTIAKLKSGY